jgi:hypothetical protein
MGARALSFRLATLLRVAAQGGSPADDGATEVVPAPVEGDGACVAFTAHSVIALDVDPDEVHARLAQHPDPLAAALAPDVVLWLAERTGRRAGITAVVLAAIGTGTGAPAGGAEEAVDHPRADRARRRRRDVRAFALPDGAGVVTVGRGLADRWELALEVESPSSGGRPRGRGVIAASLGLVPEGEPLFAQVSPGNARSLRAFLAAGFHPIGSEVLFHR